MGRSISVIVFKKMILNRLYRLFDKRILLVVLKMG